MENEGHPGKQTDAAQNGAPPDTPVKVLAPRPAHQPADNKFKKWLLKCLWEPVNYSHAIQVAGLIVACTVAWIYWRQLREMSNQSKLLGEQAQRSVIENKGNAAITKRQLELLGQQADAAQRQVNAISRQMETDQRAWVGIVSVDTPQMTNPFRTGGSMATGEINIQITNTGKTPALKLGQIALVTEKGPYDPIPDFDTEYPKQEKIAKQKQVVPKPGRHRHRDTEFCTSSHSGGMIAPSATQTVFLCREFTPFYLVDEAIMQNQGPGLKVLDRVYLLGRITYYDIFTNRRRSTKFCYWTVGTRPFQPCPEGNWMD